MAQSDIDGGQIQMQSTIEQSKCRFQGHAWSSRDCFILGLKMATPALESHNLLDDKSEPIAFQLTAPT